jgi:DNA-binding CsgD family transcriptional regulator
MAQKPPITWAEIVSRRPENNLSAREQDIITSTNNGETLQSIGDRYGISRERVRQLVLRFRSRKLIAEPAMNVRSRKSREKKSAKSIAKYGIDVPYQSKDDELLRKMRHRLTTLKNRCNQTGIEFNLTLGDIYPPPSHCPALGIELNLLTAAPLSDSSLSVDRIDPNKGYTQDNITLVSFRANKIKTNATLDEIESVLNYYKSLHLTKI